MGRDPKMRRQRHEFVSAADMEMGPDFYSEPSRRAGDE
jgi:hypothetical protein